MAKVVWLGLKNRIMVWDKVKLIVCKIINKIFNDQDHTTLNLDTIYKSSSLPAFSICCFFDLK